MKKWATAGILLVVLYIASYVPLSLTGNYQRTPRGYIGMVYWHPVGMVSHEARTEEPSLNAMGYLYYPLVAADRALVHRPYHKC